MDNFPKWKEFLCQVGQQRKETSRTEDITTLNERKLNLDRRFFLDSEIED